MYSDIKSLSITRNVEKNQYFGTASWWMGANANMEPNTSPSPPPVCPRRRSASSSSLRREARLAATCSPVSWPWDFWFQFASVIQRDRSLGLGGVYLLKHNLIRMAKSPGVWKALRSDLSRFSFRVNQVHYWLWRVETLIEEKCGIRVQVCFT